MRPCPLVALVASVVVLLGLPSPSEAKIVPVVIGWGEQISPVVDVPNSEAPFDIGYKYSSFRIFWVPVATWGGQFVLYQGDRYQELTEAEIAALEADYGPLSEKVDFWIKYVNYFWLIVVALIVVGCWRGARRRKEARAVVERVNALMEQPKYKEALDLFFAELKQGGEKPDGDAALNKAVAHLTANGVPADEAKESFQLVLGAVMAQAQAQAQLAEPKG